MYEHKATETPTTRRKKDKRPRRLWPPIWLRIILAIPLLVILWLRITDPAGDRGMDNVNTFMLVMLTILLASPWFIFFSGYSRWLRFGLPVVIPAAIVLFFNLFTYTGVSGTLVPSFRFRFAEAGPVLSLPASGGSATGGAGIDLITTTSADFPGFLGADRSGIVTRVRLARNWDARSPEMVWRQPIGEGWSAFSIVNGNAVTMEQRGDNEAVTAYDARTGELLWSYAVPGRFSHVLGGVGPRSTPTIDQGRVYALGTGGHLVCLDGSDGREIWKKNLLEEYGVTPEQEAASIQYGRSNSALVIGDRVIIPAGGNKGGRIASLAAYDKNTGETIWEVGERQISFASPRLATVGGVEQILIVNEDTLSGHDPSTGRILWEHPWSGVTAANASISQAVPVPPDRVFISKGYGGGAALLKLVPKEDGLFDVAELWHSPRVLRTKFTNVVIRGSYVYGLSDGILECADLETGERVWKGGRYGHGQILGVGDLVLLLSESGEVILLDPSPEEANMVLGRFQAIEGLTWNNLALYGDLLLVRNGQEAAAWRLPLAGPPG